MDNLEELHYQLDNLLKELNLIIKGKPLIIHSSAELLIIDSSLKINGVGLKLIDVDGKENAQMLVIDLSKFPSFMAKLKSSQIAGNLVDTKDYIKI